MDNKVAALLVLVILGSVGTIAVTIKRNTVDKELQETSIKIPNVKILNAVDEIRSDHEVFVINESVLKETTAVELYNNLAKRMEDGGFAVVLYKVDKDEKRKFFEAWLKALTKSGQKMPLIPVSKVSEDKKSLKIDERVFAADIVALSARPFGMFIIEESDDPVSDLEIVTHTFNEEKSIESLSASIENFDYIGYIGWKTKAIENIGKESVKVDYYVARTSVGGKTYRFFLAKPQHSAIGYDGYSPKKFVSVTDWKTDTWKGQVLHQWGPKNEGSNTQITFTLTAGGEDAVAAATISYSVQGGLEIRWEDQTVPDDGYVKTLHEIPDSRSDVAYTLEPSSIGLLDQNKPGGYLPMIVGHEFKTELQKWWWDTKTIDVSFTVALYDSNVAEL